MKTIFTGIIAVILIFNSYAQDWNILNEGDWDIVIMDFINASVGWKAEEKWDSGDVHSRLFKTEDGGFSWFLVSQSENRQFNFIEFINDSSGWAKTYWDDRYTLFRTRDGGLSWINDYILDEDQRISSLFAVNDSTAYAAGYRHVDHNRYGMILKTTNGGETWSGLYSRPSWNNQVFNTLWFINDTTGVAAGRLGPLNENNWLISRTVDGGNTWDDIPAPGLKKLKNFIQAGSDIYFTGSDPDDNHYLFESTDTLKSWTVKNESVYPLDFFHLVDNNIICYTLDDSLRKSIDGGISWQAKWPLLRGSGILFISDQAGFIKGDGTLYSSRDGGENWQLERFRTRLTDIYFINENVGYAGARWSLGHGGMGGNLFVTLDGGFHWNNLFGGGIWSSYPVYSILFVNDNMGFSLESRAPWLGRGVIRKTVDQGKSWFVVYPLDSDSLGPYFYARDLCFSNEETGWSVGGFYIPDSGYVRVILNTHDGGDSWQIAWKDINVGELFSIHAVGNTAWAVGDGGLIVKKDTEDNWQVQPFVTYLPLTKIFFSDEQHGWIAGGYFKNQDFQSILLKTRDAGKTWTEKRFDKYLINDMYFSDSLNGWAVGNDTTDTGQWPPGQGAILETKDGGDNWTPVIEGLSAPLNALHFRNGYGWAVGHNGLVLRTDNWVGWIDQSTGKIYPINFSLYQNYPNPFNPATMINYQLPVTSKVELSVYNLLGQRVATLVDKKQPPGIHSVQWDATGFAGGVYFYRLTTDTGFSETRKLLYLK